MAAASSLARDSIIRCAYPGRRFPSSINHHIEGGRWANQLMNPKKEKRRFVCLKMTAVPADHHQSLRTAGEVRLDSKVDTLLDTIKWDEKGLAVAIAQNVDTGVILMQGFANREALVTTISSRRATFYSRSRSTLWTKGETSMNFINVHDIFLDCDRDSIIYLGKPDGPTCHTGAETCYYTSVSSVLDSPETKQDQLASTTLYSLEATISQRKSEVDEAADGKSSWTKKLLLNQELLCSKVREEAGELIQTLLQNEDKSRTASEMADLLYHAMVLLKLKDVKMEEVFEVLRKRFSQSGIEEKNSRSQSKS